MTRGEFVGIRVGSFVGVEEGAFVTNVGDCEGLNDGPPV